MVFYHPDKFENCNTNVELLRSLVPERGWNSTYLELLYLNNVRLADVRYDNQVIPLLEHARLLEANLALILRSPYLQSHPERGGSVRDAILDHAL